MLEHPDAHNARKNAETTGEPRKVLTIHPLTDREVPLPNASADPIGGIPSVVHQWLDGELSERVAHRADAGSVEFWNKVMAETNRRRRTQTPAELSARVMAVLPNKAPAPTSVFFRAFRMTPASAVIVGAGLMAAGAFVGRLLMR